MHDPFLFVLEALLTSFFPTHSFHSTASTLYLAGISSLSALIDLLSLEPEHFDAFSELVGGRMGKLEAAYLREALRRAREEFEGARGDAE